jgi:hypothetical protein
MLQDESPDDGSVSMSIQTTDRRMTPMRTALVAALWHGHDPHSGFPEHLYEIDLQGWGEDHPFLAASVLELRPQVIVEIGVWKGASVATMATKLKELDVDGAVIAVDTWLGSAEHWTSQQWFDNLALEHGRPALQKKFMANMVARGLTGHVLPLPLDSINAAQVLSHHNIKPDLVHLDGGHDYASVLADLRAWWPLVKPGGILIGDDYNTNGVWPEVRQAFDEFFGEAGLTPFDVAPPKCRIRKPTSARTYDMIQQVDLGGSLRRATLGAPKAGNDQSWHPAEGTTLQPYRWMAGGYACWKLDLPAGSRGALQVKIPFAFEARPGLARQCTVSIAGEALPTDVRECAIFARHPGLESEHVAVELRAPRTSDGSGGQERSLAVLVIS